MDHGSRGPSVEDADIWLRDLKRRAVGTQSQSSTSREQPTFYSEGSDEIVGDRTGEQFPSPPTKITPPTVHHRQAEARNAAPSAPLSGSVLGQQGRSANSSQRSRRKGQSRSSGEDDGRRSTDTVNSRAYAKFANQRPRSSRSDARKSREGPHEDLEEEEEDDLDEVAAPAPANPENSKSSEKFEARRSKESRHETVGEEEEDDLDEVAASGPVQRNGDSGESQRESHLEDAPHEKHTRNETEAGHGTSPTATQLYIHCHLIFWSMMGTLARLGTQWITFYPGAPLIFSVLWANFGGTLIMGFLAEDRKLFMEEWGTVSRDNSSSTSSDHKSPRGSDQKRAAHMKTKKTIPLYIGLTVGFCGSYTSFSSFTRDVFLALANELASPLSHTTNSSASTTVPRNGGFSFEALLAVIIITVTVCLGALQFGAHCAIALDPLTPAIPFRLGRRILDPLIVFLALGCWVGAVIMAALPPDRVGGPAHKGHVETWRGQTLFALVFAPLGALLRFWLSLKLNSLIAWFPLGTFTANIFGTAVQGMAYDLQRVPFMGAGVVGITACQALQGVEDGFCGCLSTVSTWILELTTLRRRHAYFYGAASIGVGLGVMVVIMGSVLWTTGFHTPSCVYEIT